MIRTLALDQSKSRTGWRVDTLDGKTHGGGWTGTSAHLPGTAGARYSEWLCQIISTYKPELIAYEAPVMGGSGRGVTMSMEVSFVLIGLAFLTETIAASYKVRCVRAHVATVRKHLLGSGRPTNPKEAVMARCKLLGFDIANHDEADATALYLWAKATYDKDFRYEKATPLFAKGAA